jgi:hypothetical protein
MDELRKLIGVEATLDEVNTALREDTRRIGAAVVGAHEISCSDESQLECAQSFQRHFVEHLLPNLKVHVRTAFTTRNLGARYEWGSLHVAEHHYALPVPPGEFKTLVVKIHGHVSVTEKPGGPTYGEMSRYDAPSAACGALHALLAGAQVPAVEELRQTFSEGGRDRLAALRDPQQVPQAQRHLFTSLANSVLQARRAVQDTQSRAPHSPTVYIIVPTVVLNRPGPDTEIVCGYCTVDRRSDTVQTHYIGLGDDPTRYRAALGGGQLVITEA